ncbi:PREDICTED: AT-rich interactive domain-containing protein 1-like [Nicotiana attenuata]|uniref:At-rich interactive domain-containing protein 1 n=1 Tax=Nicotiana attenuata TaxID=49451 RepID=A0A1J6I319_NICAT|nr:PREDICTED: AT-rich interactive domain-containing protein 1-like [Nicotiana attenuata]XP_019252192.1 PREDICTED: AT-rich interactive domain-containing protein 1-like [Nicotiana attenuata]XP_019252193.1 PREDICTED: AT-rich interactive domain-containing protein 1-like [Nicotiana attenuata]OIS99460.1 at-rich interactive domain-containing protein 1 [Nicotiana attenuata]
MDLELNLREILMKISDEKTKTEGGYANVDLAKSEFDTVKQLCNDIEADDFVFINKHSKKFDGNISPDLNECILEDVDEKSSVCHDDKCSKFVSGRRSDDCGTDEIRQMKSSVVMEDENNRKRKRESYTDLLRWVTNVAKDPCDPAIGSLPERSKWKFYGNDVIWKQVLLLRDEMLLRRNADTSAQCSIWQIKQKMHPSMYDEDAAAERVRCSKRVLVAKNPLKKALFSAASSSSYPSDEDPIDGPADSSAESGVDLLWKQRRKRIPVGSQFQADIPEWRQEKCESDSKWLGTQIWPLDKQEKNRMLIERDPIGKGREDICGCQYPGSYDCIKFHLAEKRRKVKLELGSAFYRWKFDLMGEEVALSWTKEEEKKFQDIVKLNPLSTNKSFWNDIFKFFPNKCRESLVSYHFNVFLLRRRGHQNRTNASIIDSDDDEPEYGPRTNCFGRDSKFSIFCSPRKEHLDSR